MLRWHNITMGGNGLVMPGGRTLHGAQRIMMRLLIEAQGSVVDYAAFRRATGLADRSISSVTSNLKMRINRTIGYDAIVTVRNCGLRLVSKHASALPPLPPEAWRCDAIVALLIDQLEATAPHARAVARRIMEIVRT